MLQQTINRNFQRKCSVSPGRISYLQPLSKYINNGQLSVKNALEICKIYFAKFNKENIGKQKRWEPKISIEETIPYLKLTNNLGSVIGETTKNHHLKFVPISHSVKSRKPIKDDFELNL